ncbi:MAG: monovalent cation/H+ antiporter subunit D family protein [Verrucomicrobiae bacterium]|nr:monovalent cation/H+ antiporter subunit D family protein [Verrucomicrobiae bacterium]
MELVQDTRLLLAVLAPLLGACATVAFGKRPNLRDACSFVTAALLFGLIAWIAPAVYAGQILHFPVFKLLPGVSIALRADPLSMIFALVASLLWVLTVFYSIGYMRGLNEHAQTRFAACFALALFGAIGCAFSDNLFTLYLFYELISITTYPLVAHHQDAEAYESGRKYLTYLVGAAKAAVLPAMVVLYVLVGNLDFAHGVRNGIIPADADRWVVTLLYVCFVLGFAKNALMPLHSWLPTAMVAPTPVSALLHAVAVVKAGGFATTRVMLYVFGVEKMASLNLGLPTACFVSVTIVAASVIALTKDNLKLRLAYSTVSQLAYIILGVALLTPAGVEGGLIHIPAHAFGKITLFFCAGAVYVAARKQNISEMGGLGRTMPVTFGAFGLASLSMIGAPPVGGFVSKWYLLRGALDAGSLLAVGVLVLSTILNAAYFVPVVYHAFFGQSAEAKPHNGVREADLRMLVPLSITALLSVLLGVYPEVFMGFAKKVFVVP